MEIATIRTRLESVLVEGTCSDSPEDLAALAVTNPLLESGLAPSGVLRPANVSELPSTVTSLASAVPKALE